MHIIYAVTTCTDKVYSRLFEKVLVKPAFQSQKYHRLLIEGLAYNVDVDVVANPPVNRSVLNRAVVRLPDEVDGGVRYHNINAVRNPLLKLVKVFWGTFFKTMCLARRDSVIFVDCLNRSAAFSGLLAARLRRCRCVGIITDLPDMLVGSTLSKRMANFVIRHCTDYVLLTEKMNEYIGNRFKPFIVLEGHADIEMRNKCPSEELKAKPRVCFYAGGVSKKYGVENLVEGFRKANLNNTQLHIYGHGDYVDELKVIADEDRRIFYGGMLMNSEIIKKEMEATLLINPRPTNEEFVKYSFPSKNMEYMASGTPVLTTILPGMPKEYYQYVYLLQDETADGIAEELESVLSNSDAELFRKGNAARDFILAERNNIVQASKIINMLCEFDKGV